MTLAVTDKLFEHALESALTAGPVGVLLFAGLIILALVLRTYMKAQRGDLVAQIQTTAANTAAMTETRKALEDQRKECREGHDETQKQLNDIRGVLERLERAR